MSLLTHPLRLFDTIADHIVVVVGVVLVSQIPAYMDHYAQRLGGHVAEARRNVEGWEAIAGKATEGDLAKLSEVYLASEQSEVIEAGAKCVEDVARFEQLNTSLVALNNASGWSRPAVFVRTADAAVARSALGSFSPGIPLHAEGLVYALAGMLFSLMLYRGVRGATVRGCRVCGRRLRGGMAHRHEAAAQASS